MQLLKSISLIAITSGLASSQDCNQAVVIDGSGASVVLPGTFGGAQEITVEAWVRCNPAIGSFQTIVGPGTAIDLVHLQLSTGGNCAFFHDQGFTFLPVLNPGDFADWHHVALSIKSGDTRLYRDGIEIGNSTAVFGSLNSNAVLQVGRNAQTDRFLDGAVDELRVWSTARSQQEIQSTMSLRLDASATSGMSNLLCNISFEGSALDLATGQFGSEQGTIEYENADGFISNPFCDCNQNGVADDQDIASGTSLDCNSNSVPDECDIANGLDCNGNGFPDSCDIASGLALDCNNNGLPDDCDVANGLDCNGNGIPDSCDIASGFAPDCNNNGIPDDCDIANDPSIDANLNSVPDSCEVAGSRYWILSPVTGNWYAVTDELDVTQAQLTALNWGGDLVTIDDQAENDWLAATFGDASTPIWTGFNDASTEGSFEWVSGAVPGFTAWDTATGQPDDAPGVFGGADFAVLEPVSGFWYDEPSDATSFAPGLPRGVVELVSSDCDNNGIPDTYELIQDPSLDCDGNGIHDLCDLQDPALDCDGNGVLDSCQIAADPSLDCDGNGAIDSCEILADTSLDCDADQTLDVCQITADPSLDWNGDGLIDSCAGGGFVYCDSNVNAAGLNATIVPEGSPLVGDDAFCIRAYDLPAGTPGVPGMFIMSRSTGYLNPFGGGAGVLCLGAPIRRFGPNDGFPLQFSGTAGEITLCPPIASFPGPNPVQPGEVIHFQMWFREVDLTTGLPTSNTTDGISVMFR